MKYIFIVILLLSLLGNVVLFYNWQQSLHTNTSLDQLIVKYPLLSKRILADIPQDIRINFLPLRDKLQKDTAPYGDKFGMYFEYLPTGTSIGINSTNEFLAASLFKLPVVMAYYKHKENIHNESDPTIALTDNMLDDRFGNLYKKGAGYKINLKDAVRITIEDSDNTAVRALVPQLSKDDFNSVYEGLDIDLKIDKQGAIITAKQYGSILKSLFFSAILNKDHSEEILNYMTKTHYNDKLPAGVPKDIVVAHKIGVVELSDHEAYMDCGIVYVPRRPYLLCAISQTDEKTARERIKAVSNTVYEFVKDFQI